MGLSSLQAGLELFNHREFYQSHECLEALWREASEAERPLLRAAIQLAAAYLKIEQGQYEPAKRLFCRAIAQLTLAPEELAGLRRSDASALAHDGLARLESLGPERLAAFDAAWFRKLHSARCP